MLSVVYDRGFYFMTEFVFSKSHITSELIQFLMTFKENNKGKSDLISLVTRNNRPRFSNYDDARLRVRAGLSPLKLNEDPSSPLI